MKKVLLFVVALLVVALVGATGIFIYKFCWKISPQPTPSKPNLVILNVVSEQEERDACVFTVNIKNEGKVSVKLPPELICVSLVEEVHVCDYGEGGQFFSGEEPLMLSAGESFHKYAYFRCLLSGEKLNFEIDPGRVVEESEESDNIFIYTQK